MPEQKEKSCTDMSCLLKLAGLVVLMQFDLLKKVLR